MDYNADDAKKKYYFEKKFYEINPDKYIDICVQNCLNAVSECVKAQRPISDGIFSFRVQVDSLEKLCLAKKVFSEILLGKYKKDLLDFEATLKTDDNMRDSKIADFKFGLLLGAIFEAKRVSKTMVI